MKDLNALRQSMGTDWEAWQKFLTTRADSMLADLEKADPTTVASVAALQGGIAALRNLVADMQGNNKARPQKSGGYY